MKKYIVEFMENGNKYNMEVFTDYNKAMKFYNYIRKSEWARMFSNWQRLNGFTGGSIPPVAF